jgi:hypothetical protein
VPDFKYKQTYENSCGAVGLMCAALELGVSELPSVNGWRYWTSKEDFTEATDVVERRIYSVTCGKPEDEPHKQNSSISLPSNIGKAAKKLGLSMHVYLAGTGKCTYLLKIFDKERGQVEADGVRVDDGEPPAIKEDERRLLVLHHAGNLSKLHWVMQRPGSVMDPGAGESVQLQQLVGEEKPYEEVGIVIGLQKQ